MKAKSLFKSSLAKTRIKFQADEWKRAHEDTMQTEVTTSTALNVQLRTALMLFKNKLPCKSRLLPEQVRLTPVIKDKNIAIMKRYCKVVRVLKRYLKLLITATLNYMISEERIVSLSFSFAPCQNIN